MVNYASSSINLGIGQFLKALIYKPPPIKYAFQQICFLLEDIYPLSFLCDLHTYKSESWLTGLANINVELKICKYFFNAYVQGIYMKFHHSELKTVTYSYTDSVLETPKWFHFQGIYEQ